MSYYPPTGSFRDYRALTKTSALSDATRAALLRQFEQTGFEAPVDPTPEEGVYALLAALGRTGRGTRAGINRLIQYEGRRPDFFSPDYVAPVPFERWATSYVDRAGKDISAWGNTAATTAGRALRDIERRVQDSPLYAPTRDFAVNAAHSVGDFSRNIAAGTDRFFSDAAYRNDIIHGINDSLSNAASSLSNSLSRSVRPIGSAFREGYSLPLKEDK